MFLSLFPCLSIAQLFCSLPSTCGLPSTFQSGSHQNPKPLLIQSQKDGTLHGLPQSTCLSSPCTHSSVWKGTLVVLAVQSHSHTGSEDKGGAKVPFSGKSKPHRSQSLSKVTFLRIVKGHLLLRFLLPPSFHEHSALSSQCFYSPWVLLLSFPLFLHQLPHVAPV